MTILKKIGQARAEATKEERDRVMRILNKLTDDTQAKLNKKLMTAQEKHLAEVKMALVRGVVGALQIQVMSGKDPDDDGDQTPKAG